MLLQMTPHTVAKPLTYRWVLVFGVRPTMLSCLVFMSCLNRLTITRCARNPARGIIDPARVGERRQIQTMFVPYSRHGCFRDVEVYADWEFEDACTRFQPLAKVEQKCYLKFPERHSYNEFPRICPTHGILSKADAPKQQLCDYSCYRHCPPPPEKCTCFFWDGQPPTLDSVGEYLQYIHEHGLPYPPPPKAIPGGPSDSFTDRIKCLEGGTLSCKPRSPVAIGTHTVRSVMPEDCERPKTPIEDIVHAHIYEYAQALGVEDEVPRVFLSELRRVYPEGFVHRPVFKEVTVFRKPNKIDNLALKALPGGKFFVRTIQYADFFNSPDIHFGDQVLEIDHQWLEERGMPFVLSHARHLDMFRMKILPSPYMRRITLKVRDCAIINEYDIPKKTLENMRSHRDLGFTIHNGCTTAVDHFSPAKIVGLEPDYHIIEVDGQSVLNCADSQIVRLMRNAINRPNSRKVELAVIPERIYLALVNPKIGKHYNVIRNAGFNIGFWTENKVFGVW